MNPVIMLQLKNQLEQFQNNHPKVLSFFEAVGSRMEPGDIIEIKVTGTDGKNVSTNMKLTPADMELFRQLQKLGSSQDKTK